ncbi:C-type lectin 37Db-like [Rhopalosiphum padi]|uniref:C-type lectin 37Db-like n=1 Tax=Rhopalosiphum padi TaxID=40932 RepID=UPI00298DD269|nr:C-type lectin 37Db-like [Rhopalosiphum padi]
MIFSKRNLFVITLTAFIVSDMTTNADPLVKKEDEIAVFNFDEYTMFSPMPVTKWPVVKSGSKYFYIGTFFKADWFKSMEFCNLHGMRLASITTEQENKNVVKQLENFGYGQDSHFWTSGNDLSVEGTFVWSGNGRKFGRYTNWLAGEPNNTKVDDKDEDCVEYWYKGNEGFKWNDQFCTFQANFICELVN